MYIAPKAGKMKCRMTMQIAARYLNVMPVVDTEYAQVQIFVHVRSAGKKGIKCSAKMYFYFSFHIFQEGQYKLLQSNKLRISHKLLLNYFRNRSLCLTSYNIHFLYHVKPQSFQGKPTLRFG